MTVRRADRWSARERQRSPRPRPPAVAPRVGGALLAVCGMLALVDAAAMQGGRTGGAAIVPVVPGSFAPAGRVTTVPPAAGDTVAQVAPTSAGERHAGTRKFEPSLTPAFCGSCHDVALFNGFRLEEAFDAYHLSPAADRGAACQVCHTGGIAGVAAAADPEPPAIDSGVPAKRTPLARHRFAGQGDAVIHPTSIPRKIQPFAD